MKSEYLSHFTLTYLPVIGLFLFLFAFICACVWVFRKKSSLFYKDMGEIPFNKEKL